ncbi:MAG: galactokinase [Defluviitaleaceae bacterium]|nr:galactokinase [Defluviitaleaceae bacterium]MCL2239585.1 galactokinase [Defluviitaleaceae bacterium]
MGDLTKEFHRIFGDSREEAVAFFVPGRINIIGEHIDYNGGYVLPCTIKMGTSALIRKRGDSTARFASTNMSNLVEIPLGHVAYEAGHGWANYPKGIVRHMQLDGHTIPGFDILFSGDIPNGSGLSSSASIEVVTAKALNTVFSLGYEMIDLVQLAQKSENVFCGVNCGIMDQFAVGMGREDAAIYLHCDTLDFKYIPLNLGEYTFVVMNTHKRRELADSKYNERRGDCERALALLSKATPIKQLTGLAPDAFEEIAHTLPEETLRRRARHVVYENHRVKQAVQALEAGDMHALGQLLTQSHISLRDDYEVTGFELDTLVDAALQNPACIGARMTGAGFGGCAIALVEKGKVDAFKQTVAEAYEKVIGYAPGMY